ncbi:MAG TPA: energy transducer TonB [Saprospiraceae bacterium]|nr:energy transducer TonB [Saprospiraceae bacterium]
MKKIGLVILLFFIGVSFVSAQKSNKKPTKTFDAIYRNPQDPARFPGCEEKEREYLLGCSQHKLGLYIKEKIKYPKACVKDSIEGISFISIVVDTSGMLSQIHVDKKAPHPDMDKEALRIVKTMNKMKEKWIPGMQNGRKITSQTVIPVKFKIKVPKPAPAPKQQEVDEK